MPIDYKKYSKNWPEIRARILERAKNACEECGVKNYYFIVRDKGKVLWYGLEGNMELETLTCCDGYKATKIVLTIAHLDHNIKNNEDDNLKALCQKCHLAYDSEHHGRSRIKNRILKLEKQGQGKLI